MVCKPSQDKNTWSCRQLHHTAIRNAERNMMHPFLAPLDVFLPVKLTASKGSTFPSSLRVHASDLCALGRLGL